MLDGGEDPGKTSQRGVMPVTAPEGARRQLRSERQQQEQYSHQLTCAPHGQPAFDPGKDRAREQQVCKRENQQRDGRQWKQPWLRHADAYPDAEQAQQGDGGHGIERAVKDSRKKICRVSEREAQKARGIESLGCRRGGDGQQLPVKQQTPEQHGQPLRLSADHYRPRREPDAYSSNESGDHPQSD